MNIGTNEREEMKMLELICRIPEHIGWTIVGAVGTFAFFVAVGLVWVIVDMIVDYFRADEEPEYEEL
jgi:hypothetical protein